jgi:hypothetical protein
MIPAVGSGSRPSRSRTRPRSRSWNSVISPCSRQRRGTGVPSPDGRPRCRTPARGSHRWSSRVGLDGFGHVQQRHQAFPVLFGWLRIPELPRSPVFMRTQQEDRSGGKQCSWWAAWWSSSSSTPGGPAGDSSITTAVRPRSSTSAARRTPELTGLHLARFLLDSCEVPVEVTEYLAGRLEIADAGALPAGTGAGGRRRSPADGGAAADWGTAHWISSMCGWSGDTGQTCSCRS